MNYDQINLTKAEIRQLNRYKRTFTPDSHPHSFLSLGLIEPHYTGEQTEIGERIWDGYVLSDVGKRYLFYLKGLHRSERKDSRRFAITITKDLFIFVAGYLLGHHASFVRELLERVFVNH